MTHQYASLLASALCPLPFAIDEYGEFYRLGTPEEKYVGKEAVISLLQQAEEYMREKYW